MTRKTGITKECPRCRAVGLVLMESDEPDRRFAIVWARNGKVVDVDSGITADLLVDPVRGCGYCE